MKYFSVTRGLINGEQGIKSKKIKGSWEHVLPPPSWELLKYLITDKGYTQLINWFTTEYRTQIDHVYTNVP